MSGASEATPTTGLPTDVPSAIVAENTMAKVSQAQAPHSLILSVGSPDLALMFEYPEAPSLALEIPPLYSMYMLDHPRVDPFATQIATEASSASSLAPAVFSPTPLVETSVTSHDTAPSTSLAMETLTLDSMFLFDHPQVDHSEPPEVTPIPTEATSLAPAEYSATPFVEPSVISQAAPSTLVAPSPALETPPLASMFLFDNPQMDPSTTFEVSPIPTEATSLVPMGFSPTPSEAIQYMVDHSATPEAAPIPTEATSFPQEGFCHGLAEAIQSMVEPSVAPPTPPVVASQTGSTCSVDASAENIAASEAVNSSPPTTQPSIPPGAVIIRHTGNVISHLSKRRRGKIPSNIRIFSRCMSHVSTSTQAVPSQMPPWPQPATPIRPLAPPCPRPNPGPQAGGSASTPAKRRGRPPGSGKKQKMQSPANLDGRD